MENVNKTQLRARLNLYSEKILLDQEAERQAAERKRLAEEKLQREREQLRIKHETKSYENLFALLKQEPFRSNDELSADYHSYESDDGCGSSEDHEWSFERDGEVIILSKNEMYTQFGWGTRMGEGVRQSKKVYLFAADLEQPLVAEGDKATIFDEHYPVDINRFEPTRWGEVEHVMFCIEDALIRKTMISNVRNLLDEHGTNSIIKRGGHDVEKAELKVAIDNAIWRVARTSEQIAVNTVSVKYILEFKDIDKMAGYTIIVDEKNDIPRVHYSGNNIYADRYHKFMKDYVTEFNEAMKIIKAAINPTLFDLGD